MGRRYRLNLTEDEYLSEDLDFPTIEKTKNPRDHNPRMPTSSSPYYYPSKKQLTKKHRLSRGGIENRRKKKMEW